MEKENEIFLSQMLDKHFPKKYIYYSIFQNDDLKKIFCKASKSKKKLKIGCGQPDRIIYDGHVLITIEVKSHCLQKAMNDLKIYQEKMVLDNYEHVKLYFIAFVNDKHYKIFNQHFQEMNVPLIPESFHLATTTTTQQHDNNNNKEEIDDVMLHSIPYDNNNNNNSKKIIRSLANKDQHDPETFLVKELKQIHQYMYENMSISNDDKAFFIALILIGIKSEVFRSMMKNLEHPDHVGIFNELMKLLGYHGISTSHFEFLQNNISNNKHLYYITMKCISLYDCRSKYLDFISKFYNEFLKYNNDSLKSVGCVLTPDFCSEIMTELLDIQANDVILDLCAGTGTFLFQSLLRHPKKMIACELQSKLNCLLQCQKILWNAEMMEIHHGNCFEYEFQATKSIINPPFGEQINELQFCLKQLECLSEHGLAVSILPIGKINSPSKYRNEMFEKSKIRKIIIMNEKLFYPFATPHCAIMLLEKSMDGHDEENDMVSIVNFQNDGYKTKIYYGRINSDFCQKKKELYDKLSSTSNLVKIKKNGFWLDPFFEFHSKNTFHPIVLFMERKFESEKKKQMEKIHQQLQLCKEKDNKNRFSLEKEFCLDELFHLTKKPSSTSSQEKVIMISAKNNNNGIVGYAFPKNGHVFTSGNFVAITGGNGGAGLVFFIKEEFLIESATIVLKPKFYFEKEEIGDYLACILSCKFKKKYSRSNGWSQAKMKQDTIRLPCSINGDLDLSMLESFVQSFLSS